MIDFDYDSWKSSVFGILKSFYKSPYIQLFPFSQLTREDKKFIESKDFFYKWIKTGAFTYHFDTWNICNSYILKNDGTYRKATNISPIFFLFISAFTKHISTFYTQSYENREIKTFYAGEITKNRFNYKKDYNNYCKEINNNSQSYTHFIKLDINNFFTNININTLFDLINLKLNNEKTNIRTRDLLFYKELLKCLGNGTFPIIRNSTALSFLATKIYLEDFDINLYDFIDRLEDIEDFEFIRYVDDLYILFNIKNEDALEHIIKTIINRSNSELLKLDLQLNISKIKYGNCPQISETLYNSLYDDIVNGIEFTVDDYYSEEKLCTFIDELYILSKEKVINLEDYNNLILKTFHIDDITKSANEVFNAFLYNDSLILQSKSIVDKLNFVLSKDNQLLKLDPTRLTLFVLNTRNKELIKTMLNHIFDNDRNNKLDIYDLHIAIIYLTQRNFKHTDLLNLIKKHDIDSHNHIIKFCKKSFVDIYCDSNNLKNKFINNIFHKKDKGKLYYLYSLYKIKSFENNHLEAFAYYKNYFDRLTAHFDAKITNKRDLKIGKLYKEDNLKKFYEYKYDEIITNAHRIRNNNPLSHASAELLDDNDNITNVLEIREQLSEIIKEKIRTMVV